MHELSIAHNIVEMAEEALAAAGPLKVEAVHVRIGALAGVVAEALSFGWGVATQGTQLEGAQLLAETLPVIIACEGCGQRSTLEGSYPLLCPSCGKLTNQIVQGRELELWSIEIADE
ncbi:MAG: hydrogenase maturation nickel metallochaperone HypA [Caldilineaceae bacterium]|nr:hydrogenase maturation nickel metallochaperone HypA [Caldilineaceae bacterium]